MRTPPYAAASGVDPVDTAAHFHSRTLSVAGRKAEPGLSPYRGCRSTCCRSSILIQRYSSCSWGPPCLPADVLTAGKRADMAFCAIASVRCERVLPHYARSAFTRIRPIPQPPGLPCKTSNPGLGVWPTGNSQLRQIPVPVIYLQQDGWHLRLLTRERGWPCRRPTLLRFIPFRFPAFRWVLQHQPRNRHRLSIPVLSTTRMYCVRLFNRWRWQTAFTTSSSRNLAPAASYPTSESVSTLPS